MRLSTSALQSVVVGGLLRLSGTAALALALVRRAREVIVGVPGLATWWWLGTHDST